MKFSRNPFCLKQIINVLKFLTMNLENLNLVELNAQEVKEIEGGILPAIALGVYVANGVGWGLMLTACCVALGMKKHLK
jgi:lactobin A/cerein 7B family class IIb bacteriocin